VLLACAALLGGCRGAQVGRLPDDRDYTSMNRSSLAFLKETIAQGNESSRKSLAKTLDFGPRIEENLRLQRASRKFLGETLIQDEAANWEKMVARVAEELRFDPEAYAASARFGFLDSGD